MQDTIIALGVNVTFSNQVEFDIENWDTLSTSDKALITSNANINNFEFDHDQET